MIHIFLIVITVFGAKPPEQHRVEVEDLKSCYLLEGQLLQTHEALEDEIGFAAGCESIKEQNT